MLGQFADDLGRGQTRGGRVGEDAGDERAQTAPVLGRLVRLERCGADDGADAPARFEDAGALELGVHAGDGIGVDAQFHGQLPHRGQLIA